MGLEKDMAKSLDEYFATISSRNDHFKRHVTKSGKARPETLAIYPDALAFKMSEIPRKDLYDDLADKAARAPIGGPIKGYIDNRGRCQKYNSDTMEFVSYTVNTGGDPINLTYFPLKPEGWEKNKTKTHPWQERLTPEKDAKPL